MNDDRASAEFGGHELLAKSEILQNQMLSVTDFEEIAGTKNETVFLYW
tara:strand:- start:78 stop:221 length:144 start_codon:yes stop_codon:yes gene_type:complete